MSELYFYGGFCFYFSPLQHPLYTAVGLPPDFKNKKKFCRLEMNSSVRKQGFICDVCGKVLHDIFFIFTIFKYFIDYFLHRSAMKKGTWILT